MMWEESKIAYPDAPWRAAAGMRDRLIHGYFIVEEKIVWSTIHQSLPIYEKKIREIFDSMNSGPNDIT